MIVKGQFILERILCLHKIIHDLIVRKSKAVILKLDFEKAYDKVNWDLLLKCLEIRGFGKTWCSWMEKILHNGTVSVKLNNTSGPYFQSHKGVRQGDPVSPLLFVIAMEALSSLFRKGAELGSFIYFPRISATKLISFMLMMLLCS